MTGTAATKDPDGAGHKAALKAEHLASRELDPIVLPSELDEENKFACMRPLGIRVLGYLFPRVYRGTA